MTSAAMVDPPRRGLVDALRRRVTGEFDIDPWGLDPEIHDAAVAVGRFRWRVLTEGAERIPETGPALLLVHRRLGLSEQAVVAVAVGSNTGRRLRTLGVPDLPLAEPLLRRVGGALADPAELRGLLRDGHVASVALGWSPLFVHPGGLRAEVLAPAVEMKVPILPVAVTGHELGRTWRVRILEPLPTHDGPVDVASVDVAESARAAIADVL